MTENNFSISLLSPFFYPEPISTGKYNTYLAKEFVRSGCSVEVVALHPTYPDWRAKRTNAAIKGVKIHRGGGAISYVGSQVLRRIQLELTFLLHSLNCLPQIRKKDILIPVFPPILFFFFVYLFVSSGTRKIGIVHDVLGVMAGITHSLPRKIVTRIIRVLEKRVFRLCDKLIFLSKGMAKRAIKEYGLDLNKIVVCYPFSTLEKNHGADALGHLFPSGYRHIVYSGALGEKQAPYLLLELFETIVEKREDVLCHIFSRGPVFDDLQGKVRKNAGRVLFHDLVPEENLYELYLRSDVQVIPQAQDVGGGAIPSKLPNIIKAGAPVFGICEPDTDLAEIIRQSGIGHCASSWNVEQVTSELDHFIEASGRSSHQSRQQKVHDFVRANFGIDRLMTAIIGYP